MSAHACPEHDRPEQERVCVQRAALQVGAVDDPHEHEAEATADAVMAVLQGGAEPLQGPGGLPGATRIRRASTLVGAQGGDLAPGDDAAIRGEIGGGAPLPGAQRAPLEAAFGTDFGKVRIHTGGRTDALAQRMSARAFTVGSDIFIRSQDHRPGTPDGTRLLAHELTHTIQQGGRAPVARRAALTSDALVDMLQGMKGMAELFTDDAAANGSRGVSVVTQARRMMINYETLFENSAPDDVTANAMKLAAAAKVMGAMIARSLNNPWQAPELATRLLDYYQPLLRGKLRKAGVAGKDDRGATMKLAKVLASGDPVMMFMTSKVSVSDATRKIQEMALEAGCSAPQMHGYLEQQFQMELRSLTTKEIADGTIELGDNKLSGEKELIGELSTGQFDSFVNSAAGVSGRVWAKTNAAWNGLDFTAPAALRLGTLKQAVATAAPLGAAAALPAVGPGAAGLNDRLKQELGSVEAEDAAFSRGGIESGILHGLMAEFAVDKAGAARLMGEFLTAFHSFPLTTSFGADGMFANASGAGEGKEYQNALKRELESKQLKDLFPAYKAGKEAQGSIEKVGKDDHGMAEHRKNTNYVRWRYEKDVKPAGYGGLSIADTFEFAALSPGFAKTRASEYAIDGGKNQYGSSHVVYHDQVKDRALYQFTAKGALRRDPLLLLHDIVVGSAKAKADAMRAKADADAAFQAAPDGTDQEKAAKRRLYAAATDAALAATTASGKVTQGSNVVKAIFAAIASKKVAFLDQQQVEVRILGKVDFATDARELHIDPATADSAKANARAFAGANGIKFHLVTTRPDQLKISSGGSDAALNAEVQQFLRMGSNRKAKSFDALATVALNVRSVAAAELVLWQTLVADVDALYDALGKTATPQRTQIRNNVRALTPTIV